MFCRARGGEIEETSFRDQTAGTNAGSIDQTKEARRRSDGGIRRGTSLFVSSSLTARILIGVPAVAQSDLLVACPQCHAWPMAARDKRFFPRAITFRCPRCGHQATSHDTLAAPRGRTASASFSGRAGGIPDDPSDAPAFRPSRGD
jgi:hypothetical protein